MGPLAREAPAGGEAFFIGYAGLMKGAFLLFLNNQLVL
jgi:hypothetical protein